MKSLAGEHVIVADLGYGDAGKGTIVDWLCSEEGGGGVGTVVRFNGGGQAGHNVVLPDGRHHTFAQFGSGTLRGVPTHLSRFMIVDPLTLTSEADHLVALGIRDPFRLMSVDREALLATPYHKMAGQARERARGAERHGSCGMGIGETMAYALRYPHLAPTVGDCERPALLAHKLERLRESLGGDGPSVAACVATYRAFAKMVTLVDWNFVPALLKRRRVVFEGAQGVLLDEWNGFHPYTTWSTTTFTNALELLGGEPAVRLGVLRTYTTRHGPGPLVTEDPALTLPEPHNATGRWQGRFRVGHFDAVAHRYALKAAGGADALALTHLDAPVTRMCDSYDIDGEAVRHLPVTPVGQLDTRLTKRLMRAKPHYGEPVSHWPEEVSDVLGVPVVLGSSGPTSMDKSWFGSVIARERV